MPRAKVIGKEDPGALGPKRKVGAGQQLARVHEGDGDQCQTDFQESMVEVRVHGTQALFPWLFRAEVYSLSVHPLQ